MNRIQTVIFDLDGTLIDTEATAAQSIRECFASWKIDLKNEDSSYVTGRTWESAFKYLFSKYSIPIPENDAKKLMMAAD